MRNPSVCVVTSLIDKQWGGESVSQSPLKDKAFSTFLGQNPPFELLAEMGFAPDKSLFSR
jgi:hypothetical protein